MYSLRCLAVLLLTAASLPLFAADAHELQSKLDQLDVSAGRWIYHGQFLATKTSPATPWTWHEDCRWSANHVFMQCSFSNTWAGKHVNSLVADTYNARDHSFWHYELFSNSDTPDKPFASRMQINGSTRSEAWTQTKNGKSVHNRIVYDFVSDKEVKVVFQQSSDGAHWTTTAKGTGRKISS